MTSKMVVKFYSGNVAIKHNVTMQTFLRHIWKKFGVL